MLRTGNASGNVIANVLVLTMTLISWLVNAMLSASFARIYNSRGFGNQAGKKKHQREQDEKRNDAGGPARAHEQHLGRH